MAEAFAVGIAIAMAATFVLAAVCFAKAGIYATLAAREGYIQPAVFTGIVPVIPPVKKLRRCESVVCRKAVRMYGIALIGFAVSSLLASVLTGIVTEDAYHYVG